ncbi:MAG: DUF4147 domain-containing protein [Acidobacteriota bacterium]
MSKMSSLRDLAHNIFSQTLEAINVTRVVTCQVRMTGNSLQINENVIDLANVSRIVVVGVGKASLALGRALEQILGERFDEGLIATNAFEGSSSARMEVILGGHPIPDQGSIEAARKAKELLRRNDSDGTLAFFLITGGGSALFEDPVDPSITLEDLQQVNRALVGCGAVIAEMNVVRRLLSSVKGGRLAEYAPQSRQVSLYISDVNDDDLTSVASGPTLASGSTIEDFNLIIEKYRLLENLPASVVALITAGTLHSMPRPLQNALRSHHLLLDNRQAIREAQAIAERQGFLVGVASDLVEGDVEQFARLHVQRLDSLWRANGGRPVALISGGEVICPVRGRGSGGRNQEFVLRAALNLDLQGDGEIVVLSAGTDGIDGNSPATGAIADATTLPSAEANGLAPGVYLENSDSYGFFATVGGAIVTGPTGNNVRDLRVLLRR